MIEMETSQTRLRLTSSKQLLSALRKRKRLVKDETGEKLVLQFNGNAFDFRPGVIVTVGEKVANALVRSSLVMEEDDGLTSPIMPTLDKLRTYRIDEPPEDDAKSKTVCPICGHEAHTTARLIIHIGTHASKEEVEEAKQAIADGTAKEVA